MAFRFGFEGEGRDGHVFRFGFSATADHAIMQVCQALMRSRAPGTHVGRCESLPAKCIVRSPSETRI